MDVSAEGEDGFRWGGLHLEDVNGLGEGVDEFH